MADRGYTAYSYLTAGEDFRSFELVPEFGRVLAEVRERGYATLPEATRAFEDLRIAVIDGSLDPSQPVFRQDLED